MHCALCPSKYPCWVILTASHAVKYLDGYFKFNEVQQLFAHDSFSASLCYTNLACSNIEIITNSFQKIISPNSNFAYVSKGPYLTNWGCNASNKLYKIFYTQGKYEMKASSFKYLRHTNNWQPKSVGTIFQRPLPCDLNRTKMDRTLLST